MATLESFLPPDWVDRVEADRPLLSVTSNPVQRTATVRYYHGITWVHESATDSVLGAEPYAVEYVPPGSLALVTIQLKALVGFATRPPPFLAVLLPPDDETKHIVIRLYLERP